jgi:hypothetical protein
MRTIIFTLLLCPLVSWGQKEMFNPRLQSSFDFYIREAGYPNNPFELHFFWPDEALFANHQQWGTEGFGVITNQKEIFIYGYTDQAHKNAVYDVLQRKLGFEYFQANAMQIPTTLPKKFAFDKYESIPAFAYREVFYGETRRSGFADWHKLTSGESSFTFENHPGWGLWVHTLHRLLPPETYFETHPEYYALRNGVRLKDQVCLSNPDVLEIVCVNLGNEIAKSPKAKYW